MELLLSLAIWILIALSLIPLYLHVSKQSISTQDEIDATHLLYEQLYSYLIEGNYQNGMKEWGNKHYQIHWELGYEGEPSKVCIFYENAFNETEQKCENFQ